ncbi:MAG: AAA family ATPase [Clostridia bacterium]|nr:AAA family ATPase [Clostridia bacterium]
MNVVIEKIEIVSFGKLKDTVVTLDSGINILSAPNESGKSTLAAFIKFIFYGFAGARKESLSENEKKLYTPWDSDLNEGSIELVADGVRYTIHRRCPASGKETVEITERTSGRREFAGEVPGEVLFGVSEDIFVRTLFFRQLSAPQSKDEVLADRLRNIAISADEQVGTKKAISRLNDAKNELKSRMGNGIIPKAERERDRLDEMIDASMSLRREVVRLNEEIKKRGETIDNASEKLKGLSEERRNLEKYDALVRLRGIKRLTLEESEAKAEYEKASAGLKKRDDGDAFRSLFAKNTEFVAESRSCEGIAASLNAAEKENQALKAELPFGAADAKRAQKAIDSAKKVWNISLYAAIACAIIGLLVYFIAKTPAGFLGIALAVVLISVGAVFLAKPNSLAKELGVASVSELKAAIARVPSLEKQIADSERKVSALKGSYDESRLRCNKLKSELDSGIGAYIDSAEGADYSEQIQFILSASAESGEKLAVWRSKKDELAKATDGVDIESLAEEASGAKAPEREKNVVDREISFYSQQLEQLSERNRRDELECAEAEGKSGDTATMVGKRDSLNALISDLSVKHKAYEKAISAIEAAGDYMKSMVAPRIGARADEYFSAATGGKYSAFEVDTRLSMSYGEDFRRSCDYLSAGTRDSAYLSLRLALADMLFGGCGVPIILDDAFVRIDDSRLRMMSGALAEAAKKHQIIIMTHSDRESNALADVGLDYTEISLKKAE